jgi:hypothetical protein
VRPLLNGDLWPLTGHYAFLDAPQASVVEVLGGWRRGLGTLVSVEPVAGSLRGLLTGLEPLGLGHLELVLPTESAWTSYFSNARTGADEAPVGYLARVLHCRALYLIWWPVRGFEALRFQLLADHPTDFLNHERTVAVQRDDRGRLVFTAIGPVQPYERTAAYRARRIPSRLTPDRLDEYARALGIRPFDEAFYGPAGWLVTTTNPRPDISFSIADLQARYGFARGSLG